MKKVSLLLSLSLLLATFGTKPMQGMAVPSDFGAMIKAAQKLNLSVERLQGLVDTYGSLAAVILAKRYNLPMEESIKVMKAAAQGKKTALKRAIIQTNRDLLGTKWKRILADFKMLNDTEFARKYSPEMQQAVPVVLGLYSAASDLYFKKKAATFYLTSTIPVSKVRLVMFLNKLNKALGISIG